VVVHPQEEFTQWVATQQQPTVDDPHVRAGRDLFQSTSCMNCHRVDETVASGTFGPDLSHLMSRATLAAGAAPNTPENLRTWVRNPQQLKPGSLMPDMQLSEQELDQLVAYLLTLK
jgi:cytochrome c oxidase subunit 2